MYIHEFQYLLFQFLYLPDFFFVMIYQHYWVISPAHCTALMQRKYVNSSIIVQHVEVQSGKPRLQMLYRAVNLTGLLKTSSLEYPLTIQILCRISGLWFCNFTVNVHTLCFSEFCIFQPKRGEIWSSFLDSQVLFANPIRNSFCKVLSIKLIHI